MAATGGKPGVDGRQAAPLSGVGYVGAVDLGGTKILAAVFAPSGEIASRAMKLTCPNHAPAAVANRIVECVREAAATAGVPVAQLRAVGVGAPGPIDPVTGSVKVAPNLGWQDVPLRAELERRLSLPVTIDNDVRVAVLAEHAAGAGRGVGNMGGILAGTGGGGGVGLDWEI